MQTKKLTKDVWFDILNKVIPFPEAMKIESAHKGWNYFYKDVKAICPDMNKEEAFNAAYDKFIKRFGQFGVVEDDITFSPIF